MEESDNHALFFECKCRHFGIKNTAATQPRHKHSTGSTVLPLGLAQPKEQPCLLRQLSCFYLLPFPRKKLGDLTTWTPHICLPKCHFHSVFITKIVWSFFSRMYWMTHRSPSPHPWFDPLIILGEKYKFAKLLILHFSQPPCYFLLDLNVFLITLFSDTLSLWSFWYVTPCVGLA